jgi:hypothetical protein
MRKCSCLSSVQSSSEGRSIDKYKHACMWCGSFTECLKEAACLQVLVLPALSLICCMRREEVASSEGCRGAQTSCAE